MKPDLSLLASVQAEGLVRRRRRGASVWFVSVPYLLLLRLVRAHARLLRQQVRARELERESAARDAVIADLRRQIEAKDRELAAVSDALHRKNERELRQGDVQRRSERSALNAAIDRTTDFRRPGFVGGLAGL